MLNSKKPELKISVISDYICPFCFIGHKRLNSLRNDYELKIQWCFVEIHPETPVMGQPVAMLDYSSDYWDTLMIHLHRLADDEGITLPTQTIVTNSRKALLLAEKSKSLGSKIFNPLNDRIFEAYFVDGQNIGDESILRNIANECHIPEYIIEKAWQEPYANGPEDKTPKLLLPYLQYAGSINASSVPTIIINNQKLSGVVEKSVLKNAARLMIEST
ncbi:MAG: hypothetical protein HN826_10990 [Methylococcales bacterium]|jgi:predicted DsbA family dithiol-disulfide isomerase|nr:hypothetical protein [Methylococcales bacterium]